MLLSIKLLFLLNIILLITSQETKEESFSSILDFDFNNISGDTLKKYKDFDFAKDKQNILSIQEKMKKVSCLKIINNVIKEANNDLKNKLKQAKEENKENFKKFIKNLTETCTGKINKEEINKILDYQNIIDKKNKVDNDLIKFNENFDKLLKENEKSKKLKEIENEKMKRNYRIKMIVYIMGIIIICFVIISFGKKLKKKKVEEKDGKKEKKEKKDKSKKKMKKD